jgi:hypothetical protein
MGDSPPTVETAKTTSLLTLLERDLEKVGKRSVKDCLRSKTLPCPEVVAALEQKKVDRQELHLSHCSILTSYLGTIRRAINNRSQQQSSLWYISRVATVFRFLQVLFEYNPQTEGDENLNHNAAYAAGDAEINKMILQKASRFG